MNESERLNNPAMNTTPPNQTPPTEPTSSPPLLARRWPLDLHQSSAWLTIGLVVLALILISYFGLKHKSNNRISNATNSASVSITNTGFSPQEISIKPGTQVTWTNTDKAAHQVAADPYPKNNSIPGFNSDVLLQTNDSYSFSFTKPGTYLLHDQLNPLQLLGTVVVK